MDKLAQVQEVFKSTFADLEVTVVGGFPEPFYRAAAHDHPAEIRFTRDYLNSCLHEIAHWCIAGSERRKRDDFGYWYAPDGRGAVEQQAFFRAEAAPQAIERAFSLACGAAFRMSCDNLGGEVSGEEEFAAALEGKLAGYLEAGFPRRARRFLEALIGHFHPEAEGMEATAWLTTALTASNHSMGKSSQ